MPKPGVLVLLNASEGSHPHRQIFCHSCQISFFLQSTLLLKTDCFIKIIEYLRIYNYNFFLFILFEIFLIKQKKFLAKQTNFFKKRFISCIYKMSELFKVIFQESFLIYFFLVCLPLMFCIISSLILDRLQKVGT